MGLKKPPSRKSTSITSSITSGKKKRSPDIDPNFVSQEPTGESSSTPSENVVANDDTTDSIILPLEIGSHVLCLRKDASYYPAKIIERRNLVNGGGPNDYEYYVHYVDFDRRLDEWVKVQRLDLNSLQPNFENLNIKGTGVRMTRRQKHNFVGEKHVEGHGELDAVALREHEEETKVKTIASIELGRYEIDTWYFSPFPPEYRDCSKLYFCEFCLNFLKRKEQLERHRKKCDFKHPPGNEIYRSGSLSMFEVDGRKQRVYCENLCYLAKLFLDHKALEFAVEAFLFYILCECDDRGCHMVAYFSKGKHWEENLSCILTLPAYQKQGYGKFLIAFSYELSKREGKTGTPEKPLSDLGQLSYLGYWTRVLVSILKERNSNISINDLSRMTAIDKNDIKYTLKHLNLFEYRKGQQYIVSDPNVLDCHLNAVGAGVEIDVSKLQWSPFVENLLDEQKDSP